MAAKLSTALRTGICGTSPLATLLDDCFIYFYDGPIPDTADAAIDGGCTLLLTIAASTDGSTACTWDTATNGALPKKASETWDGLIVGGGGTPTFFRICVGADDGSTADPTKMRWQDTAGGPGNAAEFTSLPLVDNGSNRRGFSIFNLQFPSG